MRAFTRFRELSRWAKVRVVAAVLVTLAVETADAFDPRYHAWGAWTVYLWPLTALVFMVANEVNIMSLNTAKWCIKTANDIIGKYRGMAESWKAEVDRLNAERELDGNR